MTNPAAPIDNGELAIDISHMAKTYRGKVRALRGIEMRVRRGEVFGLLGPNGAGKTTLVKILMTVVRPTRCRGTLLGHPVGRKDVLARVGYLPEHHQFPDYLTGAQVIEFYGAMCKIPRPVRRRRTGELLDLVGMRGWADQKIRAYSKGMRQRIGIAQTLVNDPELVVLDEPTDGVDPVGRRDIRDILMRLRDRGKTVFLNSHMLSELEMVCDRVAILVQGVVSSQGTLDELTSESRRYEIALREPAPGWIARFEGASARAIDGGALVTIRGDDPDAIQPILARLLAEKLTVTSVRAERESLEDLFMRAVTDTTTGQSPAPGAKKGADS